MIWDFIAYHFNIWRMSVGRRINVHLFKLSWICVVPCSKLSIRIMNPLSIFFKFSLGISIQDLRRIFECNLLIGIFIKPLLHHLPSWIFFHIFFELILDSLSFFRILIDILPKPLLLYESRSS